MILDNLPHPLIFAHRGASAFAPENTLAAFDLAVQQGAPAVELDAKLTRDGEIVVIHDATIDRTTSGQGRVRDLSLVEIQTLDAGTWFNERFSTERVPTLGEVFDLLKGRAAVNVELTNYAAPDDDLVDKVADLVRQKDMQDQVIFSSFSLKNVRRASHLLPEIPCGILALPRTAWLVYFMGAFNAHESLNPEVRDVNATLVSAVHHRRKRIFVYTVLQKAEMDRLLGLGVDGLFVNDPLAGLEAAGAAR